MPIVMALSFIVFCAAAIIGVVMLRGRAYRRHFKRGVAGDDVFQFPNSVGEIVPVVCDAAGFIFPNIESDGEVMFLELPLRSSPLGFVFDPVLELSAAGFHDRQVFERGVRGSRFINLTRLRRAGIRAGDRVVFRRRHIARMSGYGRLHVSTETLTPRDRVLILAPHPDDAEIAAFGLYANSTATIVTVTGGQATTRSSCVDTGRIRALESITIPEIGGVPAERAVNLGYPDGRLAEMHAEPDRDFDGEGDGGAQFTALRRLNRSPLVREETECSWRALERDLAHVLAQVKPTVIVTPHPWLDDHRDHLFTSVAVCSVLQRTAQDKGRLYFYLNHNRHSELWPFGPAGAGVAMLPIRAGDLLECDSAYSHALDADRQRLKRLAIGSAFDLRDPDLCGPRTPSAWIRTRYRRLAAWVHGLGSPPTSYLRRAVRPDEVFLTASFERGCGLCERTLQRIAAQ